MSLMTRLIYRFEQQARGCLSVESPSFYRCLCLAFQGVLLPHPHSGTLSTAWQHHSSGDSLQPGLTRAGLLIFWPTAPPYSSSITAWSPVGW